MKNLLKVLIVLGIVVASLVSVKLGMELWSTKVKKYFVVDKY